MAAWTIYSNISPVMCIITTDYLFVPLADRVEVLNSSDLQIAAVEIEHLSWIITSKISCRE